MRIRTDFAGFLDLSNDEFCLGKVSSRAANAPVHHTCGTRFSGTAKLNPRRTTIHPYPLRRPGCA